MLVINCVRQTWFFGRSHERAGRMTSHICSFGIGRRCVRKSSFIRGSPPKTRVGKGKNPLDPVPVIGFGDGTSPPRPTPGTGKNDMM